MARYIKFEDVLEALDEIRCSDCSYEKPLDCSLCQISSVHKQILTKPVYFDVAPVKEIFEEIDKIILRYLNDKEYSTGEMVYDLDQLKERYAKNL